MAKTLEAHDRRIREIFEGAYRFVVPDYQRPYAWTTEQAGELFNDLLSAMRDAATMQSPSQYFLGSIVIVKRDGESQSLVVDGQQRLTTLTILLAALRAAIPEAADDITDFLYKKGKAILGEANEYRFFARDEDEAFFRANVQEPGGIEALVVGTAKLADSRLRYRENAGLLLERSRALPPAERSALLKYLLNDCSLVVISTPDFEAAYRIFSVLNDRGLDLAPIDIIKAAVLGDIRRSTDEQTGTAYARKWSETEQALGREAFGELFGHIRSIYAKQKQRATLVKEFRDNVTEYARPRELIDSVIVPLAKVWGYVRGEDFEATECAEDVNAQLAWLNRVDFNDWVPPALVYLRKFVDRPRRLAAFLQCLERLTYFLLITKAGINERIDVFAELTRQIEAVNFDGDPSGLSALKLTETQKREFRDALDGDIYRKLPKARMALVLRLEALLSDGSKKQSFSHLSLEHVLPQNPRAQSEWLRWFPNEEEREAWTHRLANLVPLHVRKNPAASNLDFSFKKSVYFTGNGTSSPFILTNEVRQVVEWTPDKLQARQHRLLNVLHHHWNLTASDSATKVVVCPPASVPA